MSHLICLIIGYLAALAVQHRSTLVPWIKTKLARKTPTAGNAETVRKNDINDPPVSEPPPDPPDPGTTAQN